MKKQVSKILSWLIVFMVVFQFQEVVLADAGPKPSIHITFENMSEEVCYGTLLSKDSVSGPYIIASEEDYSSDYTGEELEVWQWFVDYQDSDGYYFLQIMWNVSEEGSIDWTYYPPDSFKILLYYPETGDYVISDIYDTYAFDSYYTVDMNSVETSLVANTSYDYSNEIKGFLVRFIITFVIEMLVGLLFGFRNKKQISLLLVVNLITQLVLNITLSCAVYFNGGGLNYVFLYIGLEIAIFIVEAIIYYIFMNKLIEKKRKASYYVGYSIVANIASFASGIVLMMIFPSWF